ncbi:MFS transporter [Aquibacillus albus]|uniref:Sugar phosphate permease n=1 Tax=Aquibacillus albus TaxID=1168171 RepID=A0ABS2MWF2_9BACI|nr:MFS transporter [Aquibacillus albus]MBM7570219.1 sugar phosphate permease [Aquibacillus albus]
MENMDNISKRSNKPLWLISTGHALTHWYPATFYLILPLLGNELGLSYTEIGLLLTFKAVTSSIVNLPGGMVADLVSHKGLLMAIALFWVGFPYLIMGLSNHFWLVLLCISLVGVGNMLWHPSSIPTLSHIYSNKKGFALSVHGMGSNAGDAIAPLVVGFLLTWLTWREVVIINVIPGLIMGVIIVICLRDLKIQSENQDEGNNGLEIPLQTKIKNYFGDLKELFKNKEMILLSSSSAFRTMAQNGLVVFVPLYLANELGLSMALVGVALAIMQAAGFVAAPLAGFYSDKVGRKKVVVFSMIMTILLLIVLVLLQNPNLFIFGIAAIGFFLYAMRPVIQAWLMEITPDKMGGTTISILFSVQGLGASTFPLIGGVIADTFGMLYVFYSMIVVVILANIVIIFINEQTEERKQLINGEKLHVK